VVRGLSGVPIPDATSGFRAYSREAALRMTVLSDFSYTLETLIQAAHKSLTVVSVPIRTNPKTRDSRLFTNIGAYIQRSALTMMRIYVLYRPLKIFFTLSAVTMTLALLLFARFLYFFFLLRPLPSGHVQSVVMAGVLAMIAMLLAALGILSDLTAMNRRLLEEILTNTRAIRLGRAQERRPAPVADASAGVPQSPGSDPESR